MRSTLPVAAHDVARDLTPAARRAIDTTPTEIIEQWLASVAPGTRRKYRQALRDFGSWCFGEPRPPEEVFRFLVGQDPSPAHALVERWRDHLIETGLAPGSVNGLLTGLGSLVRLARKLGLCHWRLERVGLPPEKRQDRSGPTRQQVAQLVQNLDELAASGDAQAVRDVAIVRLLHGVALRRAEVVGLDAEHVQLGHGDGASLLVLRKAKRERTRLFLGPRGAASLHVWLDVRGDDPGPMFVRLDRARPRDRPARLTGEAVRRMLAKRAREAGVDVPCRPHGLRHSSATDVARTGSIARLKAFGGWSSLGSVRHYLDRESDEQRAAATAVEV